MPTYKKTTLYIDGMHCSSCDILVSDQFGKVKNVKNVCANYKNRTAEIDYEGDLNIAELNKSIGTFGYHIGKKPLAQESYSKKLFEAGAIAVILGIAYFFAKELGILPEFSGTGKLSLSTVFLLGIIASTSTCMATSGALFMATIGKMNEEKGRGTQSFLPALNFNLGRVLSYAAFGFIVGYIGQTFTSSLQLGLVLNVIVAVLMIGIALDMLKLVPISTLGTAAFTKGIFTWFEKKLVKHPRQTAFFLGAITYLLPCGFTQTVQAYALGTADPIKSATIMFVFVLGTIPVLLLIGYMGSFTTSRYYPAFNKVIAVMIFLVGVGYVANTLSLYGVKISLPFLQTSHVSADQNVIIKDGYQIATMKTTSRGYFPNSFTVKSNMPVRWIVKGENVFGCQGFLVAPKIGVAKTLTSGENIIEFTPTKKGPIAFSCSMGMFTGRFEVI
jgi:sulfite exporter TauE/SafE/copper chaperone CopZ